MKQTTTTLMMACLLAFLGLATATAQTQVLVLHHADGTTTDVELYTQPRITFENDRLLILSPVINLDYAATDVVRFTYKGVANGVDAPTAPAAYEQRGDCLVFHGLTTADQLSVYRSDGVRVPVHTDHADGAIVLNLSSLPTGAYVLNVNGKTTKFTRP